MAGASNENAGLTRRALQIQSVRAVIGGFAGITLGEWVLGTSVAVHAYAAGGALALGLVGFRFAPAALAGAWTIRLSEHPGRHRAMTAIAAGRGCATALAAAALAVNLPLGVVIGFVWLDAAIGSGYRPVQAAMLPALVRSPGELTAATALVSNVKTTGQLVGALLGGALIAVLPISLAVASAAFLYLVAVALTAGIRHSQPLATATGGLRGLSAGVHTLWTVREARMIAGYSCLRSLARGLWLALAVVASLRLLSLGRSGFGVLMAAAALGALAAIALSMRLVGNRRLADWFAVGLALCGLPVAAVGLTGSAVPAVALTVVWGIGMSLSDVGAHTLLNRIVPGNAIGPVTGTMEGSKLLFEGLGSLLAPALLAVTGTRGALLIAGGVLPIVVLLGRSGFVRVDDGAVARQDVLELLHGVPFFSPLRLDALEGVAARLQLERHRAGAEIVRQGDTDAHRWYLVDQGELVVEVDRFLVGELRRGSQFGERSLLRGVPRAATVRAVTDVALYGLERDEFLAAVGGVELQQPGQIPPRQTELVDPSTALARAPLLHSLGAATYANLMEQSRIQELDHGTAIVTSGEEDDTYHVLLSGSAEVLIDGTVRRELFPGDAFGEIAVLHRIPRTASVIASARSRVLTVDGEAVRAAVREHGGPLATLAG